MIKKMSYTKTLNWWNALSQEEKDSLVIKHGTHNIMTIKSEEEIEMMVIDGTNYEIVADRTTHSAIVSNAKEGDVAQRTGWPDSMYIFRYAMRFFKRSTVKSSQSIMFYPTEVDINTKDWRLYKRIKDQPMENKTIKVENSKPSIYPIGGYAPGNYQCLCVTCKDKFIGDKRATQCESCAVEMLKQAVNRANTKPISEAMKWWRVLTLEQKNEAADRNGHKYSDSIPVEEVYKGEMKRHAEHVKRWWFAMPGTARNSYIERCGVNMSIVQIYDAAMSEQEQYMEVLLDKATKWFDGLTQEQRDGLYKKYGSDSNTLDVWEREMMESNNPTQP